MNNTKKICILATAMIASLALNAFPHHHYHHHRGTGSRSARASSARGFSPPRSMTPFIPATWRPSRLWSLRRLLW